MKASTRPHIFIAALLVGSGSFAGALPQPVSPGSLDRVTRAAERCPTFSWGAVPDAVAVHLVLYDTTEEAAEPQLVGHVTLPGAVSSWTPSLEQCLLPGHTYAWRVGVADREGQVAWSEPAWFDVAPPLAEVPSAWVDQVIQRLSVGPVAEAGTASGSVPTPRLPLPIARPVSAAKAASYFAVGNGGAVTAGDVTAESFAGDGKMLTNVDAVTLQGNAPSAFAAASHFHDDRYFTKSDLGTGGQAAVHWGNLTSVPAGFADGVDNDTTYSAGTGLQLAGNEFSLVGASISRPGHAVTLLDVPGDVGQYTSVAIGSDGLGLISYYNATDGDLKVAHCHNVACSSATISTLDDYLNVGHYTSITIGRDGLGLISYYDASNGNLKVAHCSNVECTSATISVIDSGGTVGQYSSVTIASSGYGLISYYDGSGDDLKVAYCSNVECTSATITTLDSTGDVGKYTSITIGGDGRGLISYYDADNGNLKVAHCNTGPCTSATISTLDSVNDVGQYTSITIGTDGRGLISYYDATNGNLKVAHCGDDSCTAAAIYAPEAAASDDGRYTSITIGSDGLGLISYYDATNGNLKVAHCNNLNCTDATVSTLDDAGHVGTHTAVATGQDGLTLVSYYSVFHNNLKVAHCASVLCIPYFRRR